MTSTIPLLLGLLLAVAATAGQDAELPRAMERALETHAGWRLLDPDIDLAGAFPIDELEANLAAPWIEGDFDRDGRPDLAAVVVRATPSGKQFAVMAIHARAPQTLVEVVPFARRRMMGVSKGEAPDTILPNYCVECDANAWLRWNGRAYEWLLYRVGETLLVAEPPAPQKPALFDRASRQGRRIDVAPCSAGVVKAVAGTAGDRWYDVQLQDEPRRRGWLPESAVAGPAHCAA